MKIPDHRTKVHYNKLAHYKIANISPTHIDRLSSSFTFRCPNNLPKNVFGLATDYFKTPVIAAVKKS